VSVDRVRRFALRQRLDLPGLDDGQEAERVQASELAAAGRAVRVDELP
jgi:hypothetical protein